MSTARQKGERSRGGYLLARLGKEQTRIGIEVGVSKVSVHQWINGQKSPGADKRETMRELYDIAPEAWDEAHVAPTRAESTRPAAKDLGSAFTMARALQRQAQQQLDDLEDSEAKWTPAEKAQVTQRLASTINVLAKLTGDYELGRRIMKLPQWKALERDLYEVLKRFPDASKAVAERFAELEHLKLAAADE